MGLLVVYTVIFMVTIDNINAGGMLSVLSILEILSIDKALAKIGRASANQPYLISKIQQDLMNPTLHVSTYYRFNLH